MASRSCAKDSAGSGVAATGSSITGSSIAIGAEATGSWKVGSCIAGACATGSGSAAATSGRRVEHLVKIRIGRGHLQRDRRQHGLVLGFRCSIERQLVHHLIDGNRLGQRLVDRRMALGELGDVGLDGRRAGLRPSQSSR